MKFRFVNVIAFIGQVLGIALTIVAAWRITPYAGILALGLILYHEAEMAGK